MTVSMKLWLLSRRRPGGGDEARAFVVRAETEEDARRFASEKAGDERAETWFDYGKSDCEELKPKGEPGIILRDFSNAWED